MGQILNPTFFILNYKKMKPSKKIMRVSVTMQDIYDAMRGNVHKDKTKYSRKSKHKKSWKEKQSEK